MGRWRNTQEYPPLYIVSSWSYDVSRCLAPPLWQEVSSIPAVIVTYMREGGGHLAPEVLPLMQSSSLCGL